ncbi:CST complex subunit TEN1, partial [Clarias magur]
LTDYLPEESKAILTSHHASVQYQVSVQTTFVEPFDPIIGAQYIVLGEVEKSE